MDDRIPHSEESRNWFDEMAEKAGNVVSGAPFFFVCILLLVGWLPTLALMGAEASQFLLQTVIAIVTLLLVALLQNSQKRSEDAVGMKLDAIAQGVADLMRAHTGEDSDLSDNIDRLAETVGLEERVSTRHHRTREEAK
jgi:low affinity Fe/Cu permease